MNHFERLPNQWLINRGMIVRIREMSKAVSQDISVDSDSQYVTTTAAIIPVMDNSAQESRNCRDASFNCRIMSYFGYCAIGQFRQQCTRSCFAC
uniref:ShKT domain-containing protein n=1 Tax=Heterorhabditis bacteriophora TaxID=37862 RepID=A0A1I7XFC9_HETBA